MALSCSIILVVWTTSFSFHKNELNARRLKLCELHRSFSNKIAHFNITLLFAVGCLTFLPLVCWLCFTGLFWWALMPWTNQLLVRYFWYRYCHSVHDGYQISLSDIQWTGWRSSPNMVDIWWESTVEKYSI